MLRRRIQIVVVVIQPRCGQARRLRLPSACPASRSFPGPARARLPPWRTPHSRSRSFGLRQAAPMQNRVAPASRAAPALRPARVQRHQLAGVQPGFICSALRAIGAILRAAAGLDGQQRADLHPGADRDARGARSGRWNRRSGKGQGEQRLDLGLRPVMTDAGGAWRGSGGMAFMGRVIIRPRRSAKPASRPRATLTQRPFSPAETSPHAPQPQAATPRGSCPVSICIFSDRAGPPGCRRTAPHA